MLMREGVGANVARAQEGFRRLVRHAPWPQRSNPPGGLELRASADTRILIYKCRPGNGKNWANWLNFRQLQVKLKVESTVAQSPGPPLVAIFSHDVSLPRSARGNIRRVGGIFYCLSKCFFTHFKTKFTFRRQSL